MASEMSFEVVDARRIGFLADTHWRKPDGSDLSQQLIDALSGADLIVHLGDVGQAAPLARLGAIAPVMAPKKGETRVIEANGVRIGFTFDIAKAGIGAAVDEKGLKLPEPIGEALTSKLGHRVKVFAFAGTHIALSEERGGVLFFNPGSPTLPSDRQSESDLGSVAILDLGDGKAKVELVRLSK